MNIELHIQICGALLIALGLIHIGFPKYFKWKEELEKLSLINRQMMKTHTFFLVLILEFMGFLCLTSTHDLLTTDLGKTLLLALSVFWGIRLFAQLFTYSTKLWKGKRFETIVHITFCLLWIYFTATFTFGYLDIPT